MNTKEKILLVSLELFAKKGFDGVSVREIAKEVGVRESALYKHYKNKQEIMDSIIEVMGKRIGEAYVEYQIPEAISENVPKAYEMLTVDQLCEMSWKLFQLYTKDPQVSAYRRLMMREQFNNKEAAQKYCDHYITGVIKKQSKVFELLVEAGLFRKEDPEIIALQFYAPIFLMFQRYDCEPEKEEEIKEMIFRHVRSFGAIYQKWD